MNVTDYLIDTSALARLFSDSKLAQAWEQPVLAGLVALCPITELEFLYSARSREDRSDKLRRLSDLFPEIHVPDQVLPRARSVQEELTGCGEHRSAGAVDLLIAATAELSGLTLLHVDRDFECIGAVTGQPLQWLDHQ